MKDSLCKYTLNISFLMINYSHVRMSFPEDLYKEIVKAYGPKEAEEICRAQNERATLTVRANTIKTTRDEVI